MTDDLPWLLVFFHQPPQYGVVHPNNYAKYKLRTDCTIMGHVNGKEKAFEAARDLNSNIRKAKGSRIIRP